MNTAETAAPVEPSSTDLKSKTLLVISSPQPKKKFIYTRLKELGSKMILLASEENWVSKLADGFLQADPLDEAVAWMLSRTRTWEARMDRLDAHMRTKGEKHE